MELIQFAGFVFLLGIIFGLPIIVIASVPVWIRAIRLKDVARKYGMAYGYHWTFVATDYDLYEKGYKRNMLQGALSGRSVLIFDFFGKDKPLPNLPKMMTVANAPLSVSWMIWGFFEPLMTISVKRKTFVYVDGNLYKELSASIGYPSVRSVTEVVEELSQDRSNT